MFLRAQGKGIDIDAGVGCAGVVLEGLDEVKVGALALREAVLAVELELAGDDGVLAPAVHVEGRLSEDEGARIRDGRALGDVEVGSLVAPGVEGGGRDVIRTRILELAGGVDESVVGGRAGGEGTAERVDRVGEGINRVGVVEGLGAEEVEQLGAAVERRAVVNVGVGLDDEDELLAGVVKVELDLVGRGTDRLVTSELELLDEVLVGVLRHASALVGVEEDVINVEGGRNEGLVVGLGHLLRGAGNARAILAATGGLVVGVGRVGRGGRGGRTVEGGDRPEALIDGANVEVDLDLVVLEGDQGKGEAGVAAVPELEGDVEGGLGERVTGGANLGGRIGRAGAIDRRERGIGDEGKLGGVTDHLVVATLLLRCEGKLIPDVHPVTILAIDALASDLNLDLRDKLLAGEV